MSIPRFGSSPDTLIRLLENLPLGAVVFDALGVFIYVNSRFTSITGYGIDNAPELNILFELAFPVPAYRQEIFKALEKLTRGEIEEYVCLSQRADQRLAELKLSCRELWDGIFLLTVSDVTAFLKTELESRLNSSRPWSMFESASEGIFQTTVEGKLLRCNRTMAKFLGYASPEQAIAEIVNVNDVYVNQNDRRTILDQLCAKGTIRDFEVQFYRKDRNKIWVSLTIRAMCDLSGQLEVLEGVAEDISVRKQAETERMLLVAAVEQAAEAVVICGPGWIVEYSNPAFSEIMGLGRTKTQGRDFRSLVVMDPETGGFAEVQAKLDSVQDWSGRMKSAGSGIRRMLEVLISAIRDDSERVNHHVILARDMSYEASLEERLRQAQKLEAIGTLASGIAHDFNNILTPLVLNTEIALEDLSPDHPACKPLSQVLQAGQRAGELVKQILTFSRQGGRILGPLNLVPLIKETLRLVRLTLEPNMEIRLELPSQDLVVMADPTQMHQVVMNLCTNAVHAMRGKGGVLGVGLSRFKIAPGQPGLGLSPGEYVQLKVSDQGHGMDREILERIFEPFFTTKKPGEGTGMGLSTVHGIVRASGGKLGVSSSLGIGSVFEIVLPLAQDRLPVPDEQPPLLVRGSERILMVDNDIESLESHTKRLGILGYQVKSRINPLRALNLFSKSPDDFDLLLTEYRMPGLDGLQLAKACKKLKPDLAVILLTNSLETRHAFESCPNCVDEIAFKPLQSIELGKLIRRALAKNSPR